jgi:hypothetical protein
MTVGSDADEFLDLCQKYVELAEERRRLLAVEDSSDRDLDEALAEQIDDLDARQRILMWRILCSGVEDRERPVVAAQQREAGGRETGGTLRGRFASMSAPFTGRWSIFAQR